ncbi:MAG: DUF5615 family PIN-like protein [Proteobacteria bacterium]|nr:DUF5615 family PIN-like protein [Pseudomonadota bacterium]
MKLLLDENLSRRIVPFLQNAFPGSSQVALLGLEAAADVEIWRYARENGFVIVSRDSDFHERSLIEGHPPQVVWLKIPNYSRATILSILLKHYVEIDLALAQEDRACIEISARNASIG